MTVIDYFSEEVLTKNVQIKDIGNCALECVTIEGAFYYLITKCSAGEVHVLEYGPVIKDSQVLLNNYFMHYDHMEFDLKKLGKKISKFINNNIYGIYEVKEIPVEEAFLYSINEIISFKQIS